MTRSSLQAARLPFFGFLLASLAGCGGSEGPSPDAPPPSPASTGSESTSAAEAPEPRSPNLLGDPSTEEGRARWSVPVGEPPVVLGFEWTEATGDEEPHLRLPLRGSDHGERAFGVFGPSQGVRAAVAELGGDVPMPASLRGRYRVNGWTRHTKAQYLQARVVAVKPASSRLLRDRTMELGLVLFGLEALPARSATTLFVVSGPPEPTVGEWVTFDLPLRKLFEDHWHHVPEDYEELHLVLEARFDSLVDLRTGDAVLDVEFDDLYLGEG